MIKLPKSHGFSLIELLIVISILSILLVLAINNYQHYICKSRRTEAITTLVTIQLAEERYRISNAGYGDLATVWDNRENTENGYYKLSISNLSANSYTITATATGTQTNDKQGSTHCNFLQLNIDAAIVTKSPLACWQ